MALTAKQQLFLNFYLVDRNATESARKAGYKEPNKQGPRLLVNVGIKAAIEKAQKKVEEKFELSQEWLINGLKEDAEYKGEGASHSARVRAKELLGKTIGMFLDSKVTVSGDKNNPVKHDHTIRVAPTALIGFRDDLAAAGLGDVSRNGHQKPVDTEGENRLP